MNAANLIIVCVAVGIVGYAFVGVQCLSLLRAVLRSPSLAGGFVIALAISNSTWLIYLTLLMLNHFLGWDVTHIYVIIAGLVALNPWLLAIWWWQCGRQMDSEAHKEKT